MKNSKERLSEVYRALGRLMDEVREIGREAQRADEETERLRAQRDELAQALEDKRAECELYRAETEKVVKRLSIVQSALGVGQTTNYNAPIAQQIANVETLIVKADGNN